MPIPRFLQDIFGPFRSPGADTDPAGDAPDPSDHAAAAAPPFDYDDPRIPDAARPHIQAVLALIGQIEAAAAAEELWSPVRMEIRQLSEVHLPSLVKSYIDIPAPHRAEIFRKTGRSASFLLSDGLDQMADRLNAMSRSLAQGNIDAFTSTMRFVEMRYGKNPLSSD